MLMLKIIIYALILGSTSIVGILISNKYVLREKELKEFKTAFNIFKTKINYTYEPIPSIFDGISKTIKGNVGSIFRISSINMQDISAGESWGMALDREKNLSIKEEDKEVLKTLGKLLGKTDVAGQVNEIELTETFLDEQITKAKGEKEKNEKLCKMLGMIVGIAIVIVLM